MKKLYSLSLATLLLISGKSFSQFTYTPVDTVKYGAVGAELICPATLYNNTPNPISMRVTREQNVMGDASNWESAFCMDVCYLKTTDSVNYTFNPMDTVNFTFHFYTVLETNPDSATAIMKWKNVTNPSNTFYQKFYGITQQGFSVNDISAASANVNIYPMPIVAGNDFTMNIANVQSKSKNLFVSIYDVFGKLVKTTSAIEGINFLNFDLPAGVYSYSLVSDNSVINSGKIVMAK